MAAEIYTVCKYEEINIKKFTGLLCVAERAAHNSPFDVIRTLTEVIELSL